MTRSVPLILGSCLIAAVLAAAACIGAARAQSTSDAVAAGKAIFLDRSKGNCLACHAVAGNTVASTVGPPLADIKSKYPNQQELFDIIWDETKRNPQTAMPPFGRNHILTRDEIAKVVAYLNTL